MQGRQLGHQLRHYGDVVEQLRFCSHCVQCGCGFIDSLQHGLYLLVAFSSACIQAGQLVPDVDQGKLLVSVPLVQGRPGFCRVCLSCYQGLGFLSEQMLPYLSHHDAGG